MTNNRLLPIKKRGRFYSPYPHSHDESFLWGTLPSFLQSLWHNRKNRQLPIYDYEQLMYTDEPTFHHSDACTITWIGHSTFLICYRTIAILTDPVFGDVTWLYRRIIPAGVAINRLPSIDYIILSHNHRDHMDAPSLYALRHKGYSRLYVPLGDKRWFDKRGFSPVHEFSWWQKAENYEKDHRNFSCTFLPAVHWSQRGLFDKNRSLWGSWMITIDDIRIYFAGDTAYSSHFLDINDHYGPVDIVLMPIGPCEPHAWMRRTHVSPEQAIESFCDLQGTYFIPMHWGTFLFGTDQISDPRKRLEKAWSEKIGFSSEQKLFCLRVGETLNIRSRIAKLDATQKEIERSIG